MTDTYPSRGCEQRAVVRSSRETRDQAEELARHFEEDFEPCPDPAHASTPTSPTPPESRR